MIYKTFGSEKLSALGMGAMRLPTAPDGKIDEEKTAEMVHYAIEHGINYFDTAWGYHDGESELVMGKILSEYPRDSYYLADKFPGYDLSNMGKAEEIFEAQLKKCRVDYFDFYLFHNVCELNIDGYLDPANGIFDYLVKQKKLGRIRHLGLSVHGSLEVLKRFLSAYGSEMEFCQIQLNYIDYGFQAAKDKLELLREHSIPVFVMEPLRGGMLASLDEEDTAVLHRLRPNETTAAWAFRYLQSFGEVAVTLSGMSNFEQMKENIETYRTSDPLNKEEIEALYKIAAKKEAKTSLMCTSCRYCTSHCPMELDIPFLIGLYNESKLTGGGFITPMALGSLSDEKKPSACLGCKACEEVCPQNLPIAQVMSSLS